MVLIYHMPGRGNRYYQKPRPAAPRGVKKLSRTSNCGRRTFSDLSSGSPIVSRTCDIMVNTNRNTPLQGGRQSERSCTGPAAGSSPWFDLQPGVAPPTRQVAAAEPISRIPARSSARATVPRKNTMRQKREHSLVLTIMSQVRDTIGDPLD